MSRPRCEKTGDRLRELLPTGAALGKRALPASGQGIDAAFSAGLSDHPFAREQSRLLKPMQGRIDCSLRQIEGLAALLPDNLDHRIAVRRTRRQRSQHDHIKVTLQDFAFHFSMVPLALLGVNLTVAGTLALLVGIGFGGLRATLAPTLPLVVA